MKDILSNPEIRQETVEQQKKVFLDSKFNLQLLLIFLGIIIFLTLFNIISPAYIFGISILWAYVALLGVLLYNLRNEFFEFRFNRAMLHMLMSEHSVGY